MRETDFDLGVYLVAAPEMAGLNRRFLRHRGATDVMAFDYSAPAQGSRSRSEAAALPGRRRLWGEIFVCLDEAVRQARHYRTTWQSELVRYVVHGLLHLQGYSDAEVGSRRRMKAEEDRLLSELSGTFGFHRLAKD